jgi:hypothetical protein
MDIEPSTTPIKPTSENIEEMKTKEPEIPETINHTSEAPKEIQAESPAPIVAAPIVESEQIPPPISVVQSAAETPTNTTIQQLPTTIPSEAAVPISHSAPVAAPPQTIQAPLTQPAVVQQATQPIPISQAPEAQIPAPNVTVNPSMGLQPPQPYGYPMQNHRPAYGHYGHYGHPPQQGYSNYPYAGHHMPPYPQQNYHMNPPYGAEQPVFPPQMHPMAPQQVPIPSQPIVSTQAPASAATPQIPIPVVVPQQPASEQQQPSQDDNKNGTS